MKLLFKLTILCLSTSLLASDNNQTIQIGSEEQLFLDDYIIESSENITWKINQAEKHPAGPILKPDKKWEGTRAFLFGRAMFDDEDKIYKMWYYCDGGHVAYATSRDGIHWEKPELDVVLCDGQKTNLVIERGNMGYFYENFGVIKDKNDPDPERRYKASFVSIQRNYRGENEGRFHKTQRRGLGVAVSRDGKQFTRVEPREPFIPEGRVGEWDRFNIALGDLPPIEVDDELWFYYSGRTYRHGPYEGEDTGPNYGAIGLAKIKRGRFVALEASYDGGNIITKPLSFNGKNLFVNANTMYGSIAVSLLDESSNTISGYQTTVSGEDGVEIPVRFGQMDLEDLEGNSVRIRFSIVNAQLYGFRVK